MEGSSLPAKSCLFAKHGYLDNGKKMSVRTMHKASLVRADYGVIGVQGVQLANPSESNSRPERTGKPFLRDRFLTR
jgi:hypothetical protein